MVLKRILSSLVEMKVTVASASGLPLYVTLPLTSVRDSGGRGDWGTAGGLPAGGVVPAGGPPGAGPIGWAGPVVPGGVVPAGGAGAAPVPPLSTSRTRSMVSCRVMDRWAMVACWPA